LNNVKQPLLVFLAAGASADLGVPLTYKPKQKILENIREALSVKKYNDFLGIDPTSIDLLANHLDTIYDRGPKWNFEHLLFALETLESLKPSWRSKTAPKFKTMEGSLTYWRKELEPCFNDSFISISKQVLYKSIHEIYSNASATISSNPNWSHIKTFFEVLNQSFDLFIGTTNYDLLVEQALGWGAVEEGFRKIPKSNFSEFNGYRSDLKLMHLHGSVLYGCVNALRGNSVLHVNDLKRFDSVEIASGNYPISQTTVATGNQIDVGPLITGFRKTERFICEPYFSYYHHFSNLMIQTPRILIVGYGFGDDHINNLLKRFFIWHRSNGRIIFIDLLPEAQWDKWDAWIQTLNKRDFVDMVHWWTGEEMPFHGCDYPDPWKQPEPPPDEVRIYFKGFEDAIKNHTQEIVEFLKS
jgi:hypothetical protein